MQGNQSGLNSSAEIKTNTLETELTNLIREKATEVTRDMSLEIFVTVTFGEAEAPPPPSRLKRAGKWSSEHIITPAIIGGTQVLLGAAYWMYIR